jgi:hypothetical protein
VNAVNRVGTIFIVLAIILLGFLFHAETKPNFIKVGHKYKILTSNQRQHEDLNADYTILAYGGGQWFEVSYDSVPGNDKTEQKRWFNFAQVDEVIEE